MIVLANGAKAGIWALEKKSGVWEEFLKTEGFVGYNGITANKREGDGATPAGRFELRRGFSFEQLPGATIPCARITETGVWVDDPESKYYNMWVNSLAPDKDWKTAEKMIGYPVSYRYGIVIEYNTDPVIKGAGSAIFLHCSQGGPTAGCVAVPEDVMFSLMHFVRPGDKIVIAGSLEEFQEEGQLKLR